MRSQPAGAAAPAGPRAAGPRPTDWGARPEDTVARADQHYTAAESARYTSCRATGTIQRDLTRRALEFVGAREAGRLAGRGGGCGGAERGGGASAAPRPAPLLLADLGCGSGLSGREISALGHSWIGLDLSPEMLRLAALEPGARGSLALGDLSRDLPFRAGGFDAAVSISAVQWLFARGEKGARKREGEAAEEHAGPEGKGEAARAPPTGASLPPPPPCVVGFFASLDRLLLPGGFASLQVYLASHDEAEALTQGALRAGLDALYVVDHPHTTSAKKFFLNVRKKKAAGEGPEARGAETVCGIRATRGEEDADADQKGARAVGPDARPPSAPHHRAAALMQPISAALRRRRCHVSWPCVSSCAVGWHFERAGWTASDAGAEDAEGRPVGPALARGAAVDPSSLPPWVVSAWGEHRKAAAHLLRVARRARSMLVAQSGEQGGGEEEAPVEESLKGPQGGAAQAPEPAGASADAAPHPRCGSADATAPPRCGSADTAAPPRCGSADAAAPPHCGSADAAAPSSCGSVDAASAPFVGGLSSSDAVAEVELRDERLLPCGGPIFAQIRYAAPEGAPADAETPPPSASPASPPFCPAGWLCSHLSASSARLLSTRPVAEAPSASAVPDPAAAAALATRRGALEAGFAPAAPLVAVASAPKRAEMSELARAKRRQRTAKRKLEEEAEGADKRKGLGKEGGDGGVAAGETEAGAKAGAEAGFKAGAKVGAGAGAGDTSGSVGAPRTGGAGASTKKVFAFKSRPADFVRLSHVWLEEAPGRGPTSTAPAPAPPTLHALWLDAAKSPRSLLVLFRGPPAALARAAGAVTRLVDASAGAVAAVEACVGGGGGDPEAPAQVAWVLVTPPRALATFGDARAVCQAAMGGWAEEGEDGA